MAGLGLLVGHFADRVVRMYITSEPSPAPHQSFTPHHESASSASSAGPLSDASHLNPACPYHESASSASSGWCGCEAGTRYKRYELVTKLVMAAIFVFVTARFGLGWEIIPPLVATSALVTLAVIDLRIYRLPDIIVVPATGISALVIVCASLAIGKPTAALAALVAGLCYGVLLWIVHEINPRGLGFGDVKLALLLGLHLGWTAAALHGDWFAVAGLVVQALLLSSIIGLVMGLIVAMLRYKGRNVLPDPDGSAVATNVLSTGFPFGPALSAGTLLAICASDLLLA